MKEFETINYNSYRIGEDRITKTKLIEYEAITPCRKPLSYTSFGIKRNSPNEIKYRGIDRIGFSIDRDYYNEKDYCRKYKRGPISIVPLGAYELFNINREYISSKSLQDIGSIADTFFRYAIEKRIFQLPLRKISIDLLRVGEIISDEEFPENRVQTLEEFYGKIKGIRTLHSIELYFDVYLPYLDIRSKLRIEDFIEDDNGLYSRDYNITEDFHKEKSSFVIYDKKTRYEEQGYKIEEDVTRFEFRFNRRNFTRLKDPNILNMDYSSLADTLIPYAIKRLRRKTNMKLDEIIEILPEENSYLKDILIKVTKK